MRNCFYILIGIMLISCSSGKTEFESIEEFQNYLNNEENGFISRFEGSELIFETKFVPATQEDTVGLSTVHMRIRRKDGLAVLDSDNANQQDVLAREGYLSFEILKDVFLEADGEIINPVFHHYERNYGLKPSIDLLFNFPDLEPKRNVIFKYRDELFGQGLIEIELKKELFTKCYVKKS